MYQQQSSSRESAGSGKAQVDPKVGGAPLVPRAPVPGPDEDAARKPMFAGATPAWEDLEPAAEPEVAVAEPPRPSASLQAKTARSADHEAVAQQPPADAIGVGGDERADENLEHAELRAAGGGAGTAAPPSLLSTNKDPLKVGGKTNPHGGPFEHKLAHADKHDHFAATDEYNKPGVHSDKIGAHVAARPGAISEGKGLFTLKHNATRYTYTASGDDHNLATPFDVIDKSKLTSFNAKSHLSKAEAAKAKDKKRLMLNPSKPRDLVINGTPTTCVLSWTDGFGGGAAWIP
ncbi:MAG TPA: hypothetical protein VGC42_16830, partial [Kofleriaceae bacterium]